MGEEVTARTFKSGNSVALRLPKVLGIKEGLRMTVREEHGSLIVEPAEPSRRKIRGDWIGSMPDLAPSTRDDRMIEERELDWTGAKLTRDDG